MDTTTVNEVINWDDIKDVNISKEVNTSIKKVYSNEQTKSFKKIDISVSVNRACCKKITAAYIEPFGSELSQVNGNSFKMNHGDFKCNTVCIKSRSNFYNNTGNFTFTTDDLKNDYIAVYFYDGNTKLGHWYICDTEKLNNVNMRTVKNFMICNQKDIITNAWGKMTVKF